jgi:hypothetical protein
VGPQRLLLHRTPEISCSTMACSHAVCRISSVIAAIFTSSLRQTRSRRSCPRRCSPRRSSVRRSIIRRSTTRRPGTPLPLSISCSSSRRHSAVRALKERRICAAVRPDIRLGVASNASGGGGRFEDFDGKGSCCLSSDHWPPRRLSRITSVQPRGAACLARREVAARVLYTWPRLLSP